MVREKTFSLHNFCLIVAQRPTATRVAGFHTWRTLGRYIRKGEKGIAILAPIVARRRDDTEEDESRAVSWASVPLTRSMSYLGISQHGQLATPSHVPWTIELA
jgi:hypothetical protein